MSFRNQPPYQNNNNTGQYNQKDQTSYNQPATLHKKNYNVYSDPKNKIPNIQYAKQSQNKSTSITYYFISLGLFVAAFAVYIGVWAVQKFALNHQIASHYYQKQYKWADAVPLSSQRKVASNAQSIALQLVLQWVMWKAPLMLFTYNCMRLKQGILPWITFATVLLFLLAADIVLTIFVLNIYNNMMYFGLFSLLTVIAAIINNISLNRIKQSILDSFLPLLCIALLYAIQNLGLPILYTIYTKNLSNQASLFLTFYTFPFIDLIMYAMILFMGSFVSKEVRTFYQTIHYLLIGYEVGFILLVGYTEVQFYYLCAYLIFRNVFSNWVMWKWDDVVKLPPILPGWIVPYYFSYVLLFIPFQGIGNIIIGYGFYSYILVNTGTLLYIYPSSLYPSSLFSPGSNLTDFQLNTSFNGDIFWVAALVLWGATTFSQRYSKKMPQIVYSLVFNLSGIYLFYLGLSAGIITYSLIKNSYIY